MLRKNRSARMFAILLGASAAGFAIGAATTLPAARISGASTGAAKSAAADGMPLARIGACRAVDGDTLRCGDERIRLIGIDSPEMPGHCRPGRHCVEGDPFAAKAALAAALGTDMAIERFGADRYGRTLALVSGPGGDLSCRQVRAGLAIYRRDWDVGGRMMRGCSS